MAKPEIRALFLDVGGVLLSNGWDSKVRKALAEHFQLDLKDFEARHHLTFDTYEVGKITFDTFLERTVFYQPRNFTPAEFKRYVSDLTKPDEKMLDLFPRLKAKHNLKIAVVSNEGRELTFDRVQKFNSSTFSSSPVSCIYASPIPISIAWRSMSQCWNQPKSPMSTIVRCSWKWPTAWASTASAMPITIPPLLNWPHWG
jgi:putative hydrolase of the HAD superfamily